MREKILLICAIVVGLFLTSCRFAELVFYEHEPSKSFYQTKDFKVADAAFVSNEILFVVDVKAVSQREDLIFWLGLYSEQEGKQIKITKAIIQGDGGQKEVTFNSIALLNKQDSKKKLFKTSLKLFQLHSDKVETLCQSGENVWLEITYLVNGKENHKRFKLKRRVEKRPVFST